MYVHWSECLIENIQNTDDVGIDYVAVIYTRDETRFGAHLSVNVSQEKDSPAS
jgi:hypothetical protein